MISGYAHPDFQEVADTLDRQLTSEGPGGSSVAVYHEGEKVVDIWGGTREWQGAPWEESTMVMSFSTTKGVASTCLHMCADRGLIDYDDKVAKHWPEFAQNGKEEITVRQVMCHESGLHRLGDCVESAEMMRDWDAMVAAIEKMKPAYEPGTANGYHALSYGWLVGELVRRVSGKPIDQFIIDEIAAPLGEKGLYCGLPESERPRVAGLLLASLPVPGATAEGGGGMALDPEVLEEMRQGMSTVGPPGVEAFFATDPAPLEVPMPAVNGVFEARSLAHMYSVLACGGESNGERLLSSETLEKAITIQNTRPDLVIGIPMMFRLGYHAIFTSNGVLPRGFGHFGFGGSGAWADPDLKLSCAMTINRLSSLTVGDLRLIEIGGAAVRGATARGAAT